MKEHSFHFGNYLRQRRKALGLTRSDLAGQVPCSSDTINKIERGQRKPSRQMAERLAECLNIPKQQQADWVGIARSVSTSPPQTVWLESIRPPTNLPLSLTPLIGREGDVHRVCTRLMHDNVRLLTLTGPPGVGKTRLGLQVAVKVRDEFEDGIFFIPLDSLPHSDFVLPAIANALGLEDRGTQPIIDQIINFLYGKNILLFLDNFEHVANALGFLTQLLAQSALLKVLVTSRMALRLRCERLFPVQPLALPGPDCPLDPKTLLDYPAIRLFIDRVQAVLPTFTLTSHNAASVAAVCHRLDGLPLAIELIAACIRVLSPQMLHEYLEGAFLLETSVLDDLGQRQKSLRSAMDWSYNLLALEEQKLFRRLAVFVDGCTIEAAETVCEDGNEFGGSEIPFLYRLESLVNKSLVVRQDEIGTPRFKMLNIIREYALEKLSSHAEADDVRRRHTEYCIRLAECAEPHLRGALQLTWLERLEKEQGNLNAAMGWSISSPESQEICLRMAGTLWWFWSRGGRLKEGQMWMEKLLQLNEEQAYTESDLMVALGKVYTGLARITWIQGDYDSAFALAEKSVNLLHESGDPWYLCYATQTLADILADLGEYARSEKIAKECQTLAQEIGDAWLQALPPILLGELARIQGDDQQALAFYSESLKYCRLSGDIRIIAFQLHNIGQIMQSLGDHAKAKSLHMEALEIHRKLESPRAVALSLERLAGVAGAQGQPARAAKLLGAAEALRTWLGTPVEATERSVYEQVVAAARHGQSEHTFAALWTEGGLLTMEQAIAFALEG